MKQSKCAVGSDSFSHDKLICIKTTANSDKLVKCSYFMGLSVQAYEERPNYYSLTRHFLTLTFLLQCHSIFIFQKDALIKYLKLETLKIVKRDY